jgi:hypothetical protein
MLKKITLIFTLTCASFLFSMNSFAFDFNPGEYQITSKVEMPGMPGGMPPITITECVSKQDPIPQINNTDQDCTIQNMKKNGNTVTWEMECNQEGQKIESKGKMVYSGDNFTGTITTTMGTEAGNMVVNTKITGTRIGSCPN